MDKLGFLADIWNHPSLAIPLLSLIAIIGLPMANLAAVPVGAYWIIAAINGGVIINERTRQFINVKNGIPDKPDGAIAEKEPTNG
jgi:hypothetical protein